MRETVKELEVVLSEMEKPSERTKEKHPEKALSERESLRIERLEDSVRKLETAAKDSSKLEKGGVGGDNLHDIFRRLDELEKRQQGEKRGFFGLKNDSEKRIDEAIKRMDKNSEIIGKKQEEIRMEIEEKINKFEETAKSSPENNYSDDIESLKKSLAKIIADIKNTDSRIFSIENIRSEQSGMKEISETIRKRQDETERQISERLNGIMSRSDIENARKIAEKNSLEIKSRMDVLQKYVEGKMSAMDKIIDEKIRAGGSVLMKGGAKDNNEKLKEMEDKVNSLRNETAKTVSEALRNIPKRDDIRKDIEEKINGKLAEFSKKVDEISKYDLGKLKSVVDAEKNLDEKMKLFALNSDVEKVWKETENLKKYIDEKMRYADSLGNSLRSWEERNLHAMEKEHVLDEKMKAFPELKLIEGRIRKIERALFELQRHFVAAQLSGPIIIE